MLAPFFHIHLTTFYPAHNIFQERCLQSFVDCFRCKVLSEARENDFGFVECESPQVDVERISDESRVEVLWKISGEQKISENQEEKKKKKGRDPGRNSPPGSPAALSWKLLMTWWRRR
jgi:hypothetical protein